MQNSSLINRFNDSRVGWIQPKEKVYGIMVSLIVIFKLIGDVTPYPNQIFVGYIGLTLFVGLYFFPFRKSEFRQVSRSIFISLLYVFTFILVSYYGVSWEYSVSHNALLLPLYLIHFLIFYIFALRVTPSTGLFYVYRAMLAYGLLAVLFSQIGLIDAEKTRVISGVDIPLGVCLAFLFGDLFSLFLFLVIALMSIKKTVILASFLALFLTFTFSRFFKAGNLDLPIQKTRKIQFSKSVIAVLGLFCAIFLVGLFFPFFSASIARLGETGIDYYRVLAALEFARLLAEYFPQGTGFYTFGFLTIETIEYTSSTASGEVLPDGMSLHNTPFHILLEGGLIVSLCWITNIIRLVYGSRLMLKTKLFKPIGVLLLVWFIITNIYGLTQQLHSSHYFFGLFGLFYGYFDKYKALMQPQ